MATYCLTSLSEGWQAREKAPTEGWRVAWEILGSDRGCHRRNLGKYCYIHSALVSSSTCHSDFEDHLIWPWSIYISCVQNQASEMQIRRGAWAVLCRKHVECAIPETVWDPWSWPCFSIIMINSLLWWGELLHLIKNTMVPIHFSLSPDLRPSYMFYSVQNTCSYVLTVTTNISGWYGNFHNIAKFLTLFYLKVYSLVATEPVRR